MKISSHSAIDIADFFLDVRGHRLAIQRMVPMGCDNPDHPVLVFLHEGLGAMALWGDFPLEMVRLCRVPALLYDRLGHGRSNPLPPSDPYRNYVDLNYIDREAWDFLPRVLSLCGVRHPVFIGHSDGGTIALMYTARMPSGVLGIVTEAAHVFVDDVTRAGIRRAVEAYHEGDLRSRLQKYHGPGLDALFRRWSDTWLSQSFAAWSVEKLLPWVSCPVLAIQGDADEYGKPDQVAAIVEKVAGRAEPFLVPGARHIPHHQARAPVIERMYRFVRSLNLPEGL